MKISWNYLKSVLPLEGHTPEEVAEKLTFAGAEVEGISRCASGDHLVIGKILSCLPHPDSDHLHVLQVDEGPVFGVHQIVCGAPNAREGLKAIIAREGANLPGGKILKSTIRGVDSDGMCCSLLELGVDPKFLSEAQTKGIEELPEGAPVGEENVLSYLGLDDVVIEFDVLPNRPDLYALSNIAQEVACLLDLPYRKRAYPALNGEGNVLEVGSKTDKCPQFDAVYVGALRTAPSPKEVASLLESEGIRSIDSTVDVGNLAMLLSGQPLNLYDADKLPSKQLIAVDDYEGDFLAMDGKTYHLQKGDIVIVSGGVPVCLAGIMTAECAKVDSSTKNVYVEAANFSYSSIRRTSNRIGLSSDSSLRFCKGINPDQAKEVLSMAAYYLKEYCSASEFGEICSFDTLSHSKKRVKVSLSYINGRLGTSFSLAEVKSVLLRDGIDVEEESGEDLVLGIPSSRIDIEGKADISEEVIRILGYSYVPSTLPETALSCQGLTPAQKKEREIRSFLYGQGLSEALTYTLVSKQNASRFLYLAHGDPLVLSNPMTDEREVVRRTLIPSLLEAAEYNFARQNKDGAFFEISDVDGVSLSSRRLSFVYFGKKKERGSLLEREYDFYDAKGLFEGILDLLSLQANRLQLKKWSFSGNELHPGKSAEIRMGKTLIGYFGELHPSLLKSMGLKNAVVGEIDLEALLSMKTSPVKAPIPSKFPSVSRDLAFLIDEDVPFLDVERELKKGDKLISSIEVFDLYQGANILFGKKSMAITITFLDPEKTLKDEEIKLSMSKVISLLKQKFGAEVRQ
mgnify:FL=1